MHHLHFGYPLLQPLHLTLLLVHMKKHYISAFPDAVSLDSMYSSSLCTYDSKHNKNETACILKTSKTNAIKRQNRIMCA